jgi:4,5-DOPA dioxygenase extradiol
MRADCGKRQQPNVMFETEHPAFGKLQAIGREITQKVKPKAVVVFSAHWQAGRSSVEVNTAEFTELIYEFVQPRYQDIYMSIY